MNLLFPRRRLAGGERIISAWRNIMTDFVQALVRAELSLFGVVAGEPAQDEAAPALAADAPAFDAGHYRSALG